MHDQANDLRRLVTQGSLRVPKAPLPRPELITVSGGKGGVGTTTIAVNLAVALARHGHRTVLVDADPRGGDAAMLCGVRERYTLADVLEARRTVGEVLQPGPGGLQVLPAAWAPENTWETSAAAQERLIGQLQSLGGQFDAVVTDAGNGANRLVQRFWCAADQVLLVTTPEITSVMDAYASIKILAAGEDSIPIRTLVNVAPSRCAAREAHRRIAQACRRFLGIHVRRIGHLPEDPAIAAAGRTAEPLVIAAPACRSARKIRGLARALVGPRRRSVPTA